jgi:hypothetical protein
VLAQPAGPPDHAPTASHLRARYIRSPCTTTSRRRHRASMRRATGR